MLRSCYLHLLTNFNDVKTFDKLLQPILNEKIDMSSESKPKVISLEEDRTGRAKCKEPTCLKGIEKGTLRVGAPLFAQGRTTTGWFHPNCFIIGVSVEECSKGNGGKCKVTKVKFGKGDFRALIRCGSAKFGLSLRSAKRLLQPVLNSLALSFSDINGSKELPEKYSVEWIHDDDDLNSTQDQSINNKRTMNDNSDQIVLPKKQKLE